MFEALNCSAISNLFQSHKGGKTNQVGSIAKRNQQGLHQGLLPPARKPLHGRPANPHVFVRRIVNQRLDRYFQARSAQRPDQSKGVFWPAFQGSYQRLHIDRRYCAETANQVIMNIPWMSSFRRRTEFAFDGIEDPVHAGAARMSQA